MQRRRIFIAINLSENIKKKLESYERKFSDLPARWTKVKNIHITLIFLGYISDEELLEISKVTKEIASKSEPFSVNLNRVCYGPPGKMPPRMVWIQGSESPEFSALRDKLEKELLGSDNLSFTPENRAFSPHITLARIRQWDWKKIEPEERLEIEEDINVDFPVDSIEIMESQLKRSGAEYTVLESHQLGI